MTRQHFKRKFYLKKLFTHPNELVQNMTPSQVQLDDLLKRKKKSALKDEAKKPKLKPLKSIKGAKNANCR